VPAFVGDLRDRFRCDSVTLMDLRTRKSLEEEELAIDPARIERDFRDTLREWEVRPTGDGRVSEETAALLLGYDPGTLRNKRMQGTAPAAWKLGGRIWYKLPDLAAWLKANLQEA